MSIDATVMVTPHSTELWIVDNSWRSGNDEPVEVMATLDVDAAWNLAEKMDLSWPRQAPHRVVRYVDERREAWADVADPAGGEG